jgi:hypothetical protein
MNEWSALLGRAGALLAAEPVQIRIVIYLALAFLAVMILEGIRMSFLPRRRLIRYLQLHLPDDASGDPREHVSRSYEALDFAQPVAALAQNGDAKPRFRSSGSLRPTIRRAPRDLLDSSRDDAA